jgi:hypothetical protein
MQNQIFNNQAKKKDNLKATHNSKKADKSAIQIKDSFHNF